MRFAGIDRSALAPKRAARVEFLQSLQDTDNCVEWPYAKTPQGYGVVQFRGKLERAHRVSFYLSHGVYPEVGMHTCDNPSCVNPRHVVDGSRLDNVQDCVDKGRHARGEFHGNAVLTEQDVRAIRDGHVKGRGGNTLVLARKYGVSRTCITEVARGRYRRCA